MIKMRELGVYENRLVYTRTGFLGWCLQEPVCEPDPSAGDHPGVVVRIIPEHKSRN